MIDDLVKDYLHGQLRSTRQAPGCKHDELSEYDVRVIPAETREQIIDLHQRACARADATINELPTDARGQVPWWSRRAIRHAWRDGDAGRNPDAVEVRR